MSTVTAGGSGAIACASLADRRRRRLLYAGAHEQRPSSLGRPAGGDRARLVPGVPRLRARGRGAGRRRPRRGEPGRRLHLPRCAGAAAAAAGSADRPRVAAVATSGPAPGGPRPGPLALPPPLHAALLPLPRLQRLRPGRRLLPRLRDQRRSSAGHPLRLLLPHADALRLARRYRAGTAERLARGRAAACFGLAAPP